MLNSFGKLSPEVPSEVDSLDGSKAIYIIEKDIWFCGSA